MKSVSMQISPENQVVSVNGIQLYYQVCGEGTPLVLLHNFTSSGQFWQPYLADLAKYYRLIIPDMRGHGHSTNPTNQFTHRQSALDIFALLDHLQINQFKALGASSGGMTLIHMATQQPERVEAMVLIGATIYFTEQARAIMKEWTVESEIWDWELLRQQHLYGDDQIRALLTQFHNFKDSYDDMNFTTPYLSTITAKTLIVHGDRDSFFPVSIPVEMYTSIPHAYLWIVPNGDHIPIFDNYATEFTQTTLEFLAREWDLTTSSP